MKNALLLITFIILIVVASVSLTLYVVKDRQISWKEKYLEETIRVKELELKIVQVSNETAEAYRKYAQQVEFSTRLESALDNAVHLNNEMSANGVLFEAVSPDEIPDEDISGPED